MPEEQRSTDTYRRPFAICATLAGDVLNRRRFVLTLWRQGHEQRHCEKVDRTVRTLRGPCGPTDVEFVEQCSSAATRCPSSRTR
jgi:hypothetical protein